jgi:hypothetical protein
MAAFLLAFTAFGDASGLSVASLAADDYRRVQLRDGSPQPELYVFGEGGRLGGASDGSMDRLRFADIARAVAVPLQSRNYLPSSDPRTTRLLVMVYWGRTGARVRPAGLLEEQSSQDAAAALGDSKSASARQLNSVPPIVGDFNQVCGRFEPTADVAQVSSQNAADSALGGAISLAAAQKRSQEQADARTAALLGYGPLWNQTAAFAGTSRAYRWQDLENELEQSRYFAVLLAYDFQVLWKQRKHKLLWETRVSMPEKGSDFYASLLAMAHDAGPYFGVDSHGLVRKEVPQGRVDVGEAKVLADVK